MKPALSLPIVALLLLGNGEQPAEAPINPQAMSNVEIKAHNKLLDRSDRNYIVCRVFDTTGMRATKTRRCHTNQQWVQIRRSTREDTSEFVDRANRNPAIER